MKKSFRFLHLSLLAAMAAGAQAAELYSNGPAVGSNGKSVLAAADETLGFSMKAVSNLAVADDFTVTGHGWLVSSLDFFAYQNNATAFTLQNVSWSILSGDVNNGVVAASGTTALANGGLVGYRVNASTPTNTARRIFLASADIPDVALDAGQYWLRWSMTGVLTSGPWQPPTADSRTGNAKATLGGGPFATLADARSAKTVELPFVINGTPISPVPEPSTWLLMLGGGLALALRRRAYSGS